MPEVVAWVVVPVSDRKLGYGGAGVDSMAVVLRRCLYR